MRIMAWPGLCDGGAGGSTSVSIIFSLFLVCWLFFLQELKRNEEEDYMQGASQTTVLEGGEDRALPKE